MNFSKGIFQEFLKKLNEMKLHEIILLRLEINTFSVDTFAGCLYRDSETLIVRNEFYGHKV